MANPQQPTFLGHVRRVFNKDELDEPAPSSKRSHVDTFGRAVSTTAILQHNPHSRGNIPNFTSRFSDCDSRTQDMVAENSVDSVIVSESSDEADEHEDGELQPRRLFIQPPYNPPSSLPTTVSGMDWGKRFNILASGGLGGGSLDLKKQVSMHIPVPAISGVGLSAAAAASSVHYGLADLGASPYVSSSAQQLDMKGKSKDLEGTWELNGTANDPVTPASGEEHAARRSVRIGTSDLSETTAEHTQRNPKFVDEPSSSTRWSTESRSLINPSVEDNAGRIHPTPEPNTDDSLEKDIDTKRVDNVRAERLNTYTRRDTRSGLGTPVAEPLPQATRYQDFITPSPMHAEPFNGIKSLPENASDHINAISRQRKDSHVRFVDCHEPFGLHRPQLDNKHLSCDPYPRLHPDPYHNVVPTNSPRSATRLQSHTVLTSYASNQSNSNLALLPEYQFTRRPLSFVEKASSASPGSTELPLSVPEKSEDFNYKRSSEADADIFVITLSRWDSAAYQFKDVLGQLLVRWVNWFTLEEKERLYGRDSGHGGGWMRAIITAFMIVVVIQVLLGFSLLQHGLELGGKLLGIDVRSAVQSRGRRRQRTPQLEMD